MRAFTDSLRSELIHDRIPIHLTMVHLPGLNTPQFTWSQSHMDRQPQPVPPIFQPEIAAEAVYWAAQHRRREVYVGVPTVKTVLGSKLVPGFLDHYLARHAFEGQMTDSPAPQPRRSNLFEPVPGDHGAHGIFDERARQHDWFSWLSVRAGAAGVRAGAAALAMLGVVALLLGVLVVIE